MFWQELLNLLHETLGPCLSNFSAMSVTGHTPHWCEFWAWLADLASWLDFKLALSLQTCLSILTLGWSQILSLDLCCSHCSDGMWPCWWDLCLPTPLLCSAPSSLLTEQFTSFVCTISCLSLAMTPRSSNSHCIDSSDMTEADWVGFVASWCIMHLHVFESQVSCSITEEDPTASSVPRVCQLQLFWMS